MITNVWFGASWYYLILLPFSWLYGLISNLIKLSYRLGMLKIYTFPLPIIVIGNLTVGGNGKTPMVLWLVEKLQHRGWLVGVVSRGYGGKAKYYPIIIDKFSNSNECGDEPLLIWQRTGVPIAVAPSRVAAVSLLLEKYKLDIIISDDGLQHYALARDIEWVVVSHERGFGNGWWIPAGPMRERANRLNSVHEIIINGGHSTSGEIRMSLLPSAIINLLSGEIQTEFNCINKVVVAMAGIGYPEQFFATLRASGIQPIKEVIFADHKFYDENTLCLLTLKHEILIMTEKDAVKCRHFAHSNWWYLRVDVKLSQEFTEKLLFPIEGAIQKKKIFQ